MSEQKVTEYRPTLAERKLLEVLLNPELRTATVTDICQRAGISRQTYYKTIKKPEFLKLYESQSRDLVRVAIGPVVNAFIKAAKEGSYPHGKVILEMAGLYAEARKVEHLGKDGGPIQYQVDHARFAGMSDRELAALILQAAKDIAVAPAIEGGGDGGDDE